MLGKCTFFKIQNTCQMSVNYSDSIRSNQNIIGDKDKKMINVIK